MNQETFAHYKVGIPAIDEEHFELLLILDAIQSDLHVGKYSESFEKIDVLREKLIRHCFSEEKMMEKINFPYMEGHRNSHVILLHELEKIFHLFGPRKVLDMYTASDVRTKMVSHFDDMDRQYIEYYKKGKEPPLPH
jgi:hemerythrin